MLGRRQRGFRAPADRPVADSFAHTISLHTENIVIREEVTGTFGESQTFPVREAASGIEQLSLEEILRGGPLGF